jgi:tRNA pseudouridine32 synthase
MALIEVPQGMPPLEEKKPFKPAPPFLATPCDPIPRPYYFENGLRRVAPYHFTYNTYCKERWRGRELLDIFASEFRDRPMEYYVSFTADHLWMNLR